MLPKNGSREVSKKNCTSKEDFTQDYCIRGSRLLLPQRETELCRNKREEITLGSLSQKAELGLEGIWKYIPLLAEGNVIGKGELMT